MAPTGIRILKKEDFDGNYIKQFDVSSVKGIHIAGERCDPETIRWLHTHLNHSIIND